MTYKQVKDESLRLIFSYKIAGTEIASTYNNQADYIDHIPQLINDTQIYIATTKKKIPAHVLLSDLVQEDFGEYTIYLLPADCFEIHQLHLTDGSPAPLGSYIRRPDSLWVRKGYGDILLEYWRYPLMLPANPADGTELDNTLDVQTILPYAVGARLVRYDSAFDYSALYNEFETRLQRLSMPAFVEETAVMNQMAPFNTFLGVW